MYPRCPDCDCDMQLIGGHWRCPWVTRSRVGRRTVVGSVACAWPPAKNRVHMIFERMSGRT